MVVNNLFVPVPEVQEARVMYARADSCFDGFKHNMVRNNKEVSVILLESVGSYFMRWHEKWLVGFCEMEWWGRR